MRLKARRHARRTFHFGDAALPAGWLELDPDAPTPVVLGTVGGTARPTVDRRGALHIDDAWALDWWVSAADGWHVPVREKLTALVQRRIDGMPVVETSMRVPSGQVVHRVWCVRSGTADWCVVELENRSRAAVGVALAVRPAGEVRSIAYEGTIAAVDGNPLLFARRPAHAAFGSHERGDAADVVLASAASGAEPGTITCGDRLANAAFVFPLAHTAVLRAAVLVGGEGTADLAALPDADAVARGWRAHLDGAARVMVPDDAFMATIDVARTTALLDPVPEALGGLDRWGHADAAAVAFERSLGPRTIDEAEAMARHALLRGDGSILDPHLVLIAKAAHEHGRHRSGAVAAIADALDLAGQHDAAAACRSLPVTSTPRDWSSLDELSADPMELLDLAGRALVADDAAGVDLVPHWQSSWLGQPAEAHGMPTRWGRASWAVRWHGARPAILWEVAGPAPGVRSSGLDADWTHPEAAGEALLAPVEPAGGLPGVVARQQPADGTPVADAGDDGATFT